MCPQPEAGLLTGMFQGRRVEESEEDMLVLNVCAPAPPTENDADRAAADAGPHPVIVYIHGAPSHPCVLSSPESPLRVRVRVRVDRGRTDRLARQRACLPATCLPAGLLPPSEVALTCPSPPLPLSVCRWRWQVWHCSRR